MSYACPCCRNMTFSEQPPGTYEVCPVCYWEDDVVQFNDETYEGGANKVSLIQAKQNYAKFGACCESSCEDVRSPKPEEIPSD